jgi:hypothetical protein
MRYIEPDLRDISSKSFELCLEGRQSGQSSAFCLLATPGKPKAEFVAWVMALNLGNVRMAPRVWL